MDQVRAMPALATLNEDEELGAEVTLGLRGVITTTLTGCGCSLMVTVNRRV